MRCRDAFIFFLSFVLLSACAAPTPTWRAQASLLVTQLGDQEASRLFPQEYFNLVETFEHGEAVLHVKADDETADTYYQFAIQKGKLLSSELQHRKLQMAEDERRRVAEQASRAEEERISREAAEDVRRLIEQENQKTAEAAKSAKSEKGIGSSRDNISLPLVHTVRRGETLPQIAARTEIYNNASLWPIIYRANRDQIRDPKQLWPGQALKIPRNFSREEAAEARRYSSRK